MNKKIIGIIYVVHHVIVTIRLNILINACPMKMQTILILKTKKNAAILRYMNIRKKLQLPVSGIADLNLNFFGVFLFKV